MKLFKNLWNNEDGATAIEYGLIAALIAVACITALGNIGNSLNTKFSAVNNGLGGTPAAPAAPAPAPAP